ncbi:glycosyltransferase family 2 protein [Ponticoccus alexandrii]|uniref:Glycosyltransferase n=1 Tax=Ponticoccus alexandrii TaxID=1943633 RepID=A0ABX7FCC1_9RHOB|nr:glycosyltransferase family 2 protein [Ponticoccus alexandrii]ETA51874.1 glucosyl transferase [Rhodobacteraceae bacterium PD-2]QRF68038.1 glycosyltransferase [Ponticoccus alexandrii]
MALISVIVPVYNAERTLTATVRSIQAQTRTRWEAILIDDGSTDDSLVLAEALAAEDPRLRVARNPGKGPSAARNHGALALARGDVFCFLDADDLWTPNKLDDIAHTLLRGEADAVFGRVGFFTNDPARVTSRSTVPEEPLTIPMLLAENPVCTLSNLSVRRESFGAVGGFREDMVHNEDLDHLVTLVGEGFRVEGIDRDQVLYRQSTGGLSSDLDAMRQSRTAVLRTALRYGHANQPRSEARYLRYLTRRAMRLGHDHASVRALVTEGIATDAAAFLTPLRRGLVTAIGGLAYPAMPRDLRRFLFSR